MAAAAGSLPSTSEPHSGPLLSEAANQLQVSGPARCALHCCCVLQETSL